MYWSDIDHSFCESRILGMPEYLNSITSLFIVFFGTYGLYKSTNIILDILYNILIILGIGSISYHFTGTIGWGLLDEIPMILSIFIGIIFVNSLQAVEEMKALKQKPNVIFILADDQRADR